MDEPEISKTRIAVGLIGGLILVGWELWDRLNLQRPNDSRIVFYCGLYVLVTVAQLLAHASKEAQRAVYGAFLLVFFGTLLLDLAEAVARDSTAVEILAAATVAMGLVGLHWLRSDRPSPVPNGDGGVGSA